MKLFPIIFSTKQDKIVVAWCEFLSMKQYDASWWANPIANDISSLADVDLVEKTEIFDTLKEAHSAITKQYLAYAAENFIC